VPYWDLASVVAKLVSLIAMAAVVGGGFCLYLAPDIESPRRRRILSYVLSGAAAGLLATCLFFLVQVGAINQSGLGGMWDRQMGGILAQSGLGHAAGLRLLGYLAAVAMVGIQWRPEPGFLHSDPYRVSALLLFAGSSVLLGISFPLTGHVATLGLMAQAAIVLHVLGVFLWIGALYPLWLLCGMQSAGELKGIMQRFGRIALFIVAVLLLSGLYLLTQLLDSVEALVGTRYGQSLLLKLLGVTGLLALAGLNRFFLVPGLEAGKTRAMLKRSILLEMGTALAILAVTAYLTTVVE
jgi:putative copper resistance protein D